MVPLVSQGGLVRGAPTPQARGEWSGWVLPPLAGARVEEHEAGDVVKVGVARHKREAVLERGAGDQDVERSMRDTLPALPHGSAKQGHTSRNSVRIGKDPDGAKNSRNPRSAAVRSRWLKSTPSQSSV